MPKRAGNTFTSHLETWAQETYIHGIPSIQRSESLPRRLLWLALFLAATGALIQQCVALCLRFRSFPVTLSVDYVNERRLPFPAVTFCNLNPVRANQLQYIDDPGIQELLGSYENGPSQNEYDEVHQRSTIQEEFLRLWVMLPDAGRAKAGHQLEAMLLGCTFNGQNCSQSDFVSFISYRYGNCYTFNSGRYGDTNPLILQTEYPGPNAGLSLELYIQQNLYVRELSDVAGVKVIIHDPLRMVFPADEGYFLSPGYLASLALKKVVISRLPSPHPSNCTAPDHVTAALYSAFSELYNATYSQEACLKTCYASYVIGDCKCADFKYPNDGHLKAYEGISRNRSNRHVLPCTSEIQKACLKDASSAYLNGQLPCSCPLSCKEEDYVTEFSFGRWPSLAYEPIYLTDLSRRNPALRQLASGKSPEFGTPDENLLKFEVYYPKLSYEHIAQAPAYELTSLLSDIGGQLGFWIGLSIIGYVEFLELLVDLTILSCSSKTSMTSPIKE